MNTSFSWLIVSWLALAVTLMVLIMFRRFKAKDEDDFLHVSNATSNMLNHQAEAAHQRDVLDRYVNILLAALLVYGIGIGVWFLYQVWQSGSKPVS
jgi:hypothetical protein